MPILRRQLHKTAKGPVMNDEDWWDLVFDTDTKRIYVQHKWEHVDVRGGGASDHGSVDIELSAFIRDGLGEERRQLQQVLESLFAENR